MKFIDDDDDDDELKIIPGTEMIAIGKAHTETETEKDFKY